MPEYDAFGREIGEDTLAGLGSSETQRPRPRAEPAPSEGFTEPTPAEPRRAEPVQATFTVPDGPVTMIPSGRRRRSGGLGCLVGLLILGAVVAGPVIAIVSFVGGASDVIDDVREAIDPDNLDDIPGLVRPDATAKPPTGIAGRSLIAPENLRGALRRIERTGYRRITRMTVRPDRLDAAVVKGGRERDVQVSSEGGIERGSARPANRASPTIALSALDPAAPARLVRGSAARYRVKPKGIDYVIAGPEILGSGDHEWRAYFKNGIYVEGDAKGRVVRRFDGGG